MKSIAELEAALAAVKVKEIVALEKVATPGPWEYEQTCPRHTAEDAQASATNENGHVLLDSLNRDYRVSLVQEESDEDGRRFVDVAGGKDIELSVSLRNAAPHLIDIVRGMPELLEVVKAAEEIRAFCDDPNGSESGETLALGLCRRLPRLRAALGRVK